MYSTAIISPILLSEEGKCAICGARLNDLTNEVYLLHRPTGAIIETRCLSNALDSINGRVSIESGLPILTWRTREGRLFKLLGFSPELSCSDWAELDGDFNTISSFSRPEYGHYESRREAALLPLPELDLDLDLETEVEDVE